VGVANEPQLRSPATFREKSGRTHSICQVVANSCRIEMKQSQQVTKRVIPAR
jgi:hypothetical protein